MQQNPNIFKPKQQLSEGAWVSHLRQLIDKTVIQPHVVNACDVPGARVLGARAVPYHDAGPLIGVAWAIKDNPKFIRESAVALLQVVRNPGGTSGVAAVAVYNNNNTNNTSSAMNTTNSPAARYAAWCLLDCCCRIVDKPKQFREEIESNLPALIATYMPLGSISDPSVIDVDDDSLETVRSKARLERKCFRRLYLEILNGWVRDPWWSSSTNNNNTSSMNGNSNNASSVCRRVVEHVVLALISTGNTKKLAAQQQNNLMNFNDPNNSNKDDDDASLRNINNSAGNMMSQMLAPEYFVKQEPGLMMNQAQHQQQGSSSGAVASLAAVKRESAATLGGSKTLSGAALSKVLDIVLTSNSNASKMKSKQDSNTNTAAGKNNNNAKTNPFFSNLGGAAFVDIREDTRRQIAKLANDLQRDFPDHYRCSYCGTVFPNAEARTNHIKFHFPRTLNSDEALTGEKQKQHRLPPPTAQEFISYLGDAQTGTTATLFINDSEHQELMRVKAQIAQQQQASATGGGGGGAGVGNSSALMMSHQHQANLNHPLLKRFARSASAFNPFVAANGARVDEGNILKRRAAEASKQNDIDGLVFVQNPLEKRSCFKCAKTFAPVAHPKGGWYLADCIELLNPQSGELGYAHKNCVF